jgi:hypothetical protein
MVTDEAGAGLNDARWWPKAPEQGAPDTRLILRENRAIERSSSTTPSGSDP